MREQIDDNIVVIREIRSELAGLLELAPSVNAVGVARALVLLDRLEQGLNRHANGDSGQVSETKASAAHETPVGDHGGLVYAIEQGNGEKLLAEYRLGGKSQPFRTPERVYRQLSSVIYATNGSLSLAEMMTQLSAVVEGVGEHHVRPCLRLWMSRGILSRYHHRYAKRGKGKKCFRRLASKLWQELAAKGSAGHEHA